MLIVEGGIEYDGYGIWKGEEVFFSVLWRHGKLFRTERTVLEGFAKMEMHVVQLRVNRYSYLAKADNSVAYSIFRKA